MTAGTPPSTGRMSPTGRTPRVLTIAGSDSGGGAGIQADLKAFASCGVHGMSAIAAITAQNTLEVSAVHPIPEETILAQVRAVARDIGVDAVKVGMLGTTAAVRAVAQALDELPAGTPVVVDPVMVAESGGRLLERDAESALVAEIVPRATVLTPNLPEARALVGHGLADDAWERAAREPGVEELEAGELGTTELEAVGLEEGDEEEREAERLVRAVLALGSAVVVLTGGHRARAVDLFVDSAEPREIVQIAGVRHPDGAAHGSGCTHSSILAAQLALGRSPLQAAIVARERVGEAVAAGLRDVGGGSGPVDAIGLARLRASAGLP